MDAISNRYEFVYLFDVENGNPNGDPDAGNLPRVDPETGHGLVTDVCLKRKIRNFVQLTKNCTRPYDIYVKEKAVLGRAHLQVFKELGINTGEESRKLIPTTLAEVFADLDLPEGLTIEDDEETENTVLVVASDADKKEIQAWLKESKPPKGVADLVKVVIREAKPRKPTGDETERGRKKMCEDFFDIRTFGAVMSLKSAPNCGQVRGPVQLTFARSVDPIVTLEQTITRIAVATEAEAKKQSGDNRTMGRKHIVPYALYRAEGYVSAKLAEQTGFSQGDVDLLWEALINMFDHDHSAARGKMNARGLYVFKHDSALGNAPSHKLFSLVTVGRVADGKKPARAFSDYAVAIDREAVPQGVTLLEVL